MNRTFYYEGNRLFCEQIDLQKFAMQTPTPFYLYSKEEIVRNCRQVLQAGQGLDFLACYAFKANYNPGLLKIIRDMGLGADVVSGGELQLALRLGFDAQKIVFAGVGKTAQEIALAIRSGIHSLNIESFEEFLLVEKIAAEQQKGMRIAVRINPDVEAQTHDYISTGKHINKFGVSLQEALKIYRKALHSKWLKPEGVHVHIGSQITSPQPFLETIRVLRSFYEQLKKEGVSLTFLDLGGGIGINYENNFLNAEQPSTHIEELLPVYLQGLADLGLKLVVEPGRSLIAASGILVSKVLYRKETPLKKFLIVDGAMNNLLRPSLYKAHHEILPLLLNDSAKEVVDVVGPVCESGDFLAKDRPIQQMEQGDFLTVGGAGAYGQALSSNYNFRPTIAEYLVDGGKVETIYQGQTFEDMAKNLGL